VTGGRDRREETEGERHTRDGWKETEGNTLKRRDREERRSGRDRGEEKER
jgi:hypothetical protein